MQTRKKGQVAAPKGDTSKKHGAVAQTGTTTATTSNLEVRGDEKSENDAVTNWEKREKAALAAEVPGSPKHKLRQALEDAKMKYDEIEARCKAALASHNQLVAATLANPKSKTKKQTKQEERAWGAEQRKMKDEHSAAWRAVDSAYEAFLAVAIKEIAKKCKSGKNLLTCQVGEIVVQKDLLEYYGGDCLTILDGYVEAADYGYDKYDRPVLLTVEALLPTKDEYQVFQQNKYTLPLPELIHRAYELILGHVSRLQDKQDNASEAAQEGDAYENRQQKIDELEGVAEPDVPESVANITLYHAPKHGKLSEAESLLKDCLNELKARGDEAVVTDELKGLIDGLEETLGVLESV